VIGATMSSTDARDIPAPDFRHADFEWTRRSSVIVFKRGKGAVFRLGKPAFSRT